MDFVDSSRWIFVRSYQSKLLQQFLVIFDTRIIEQGKDTGSQRGRHPVPVAILSATKSDFLHSIFLGHSSFFLLQRRLSFPRLFLETYPDYLQNSRRKKAPQVGICNCNHSVFYVARTSSGCICHKRHPTRSSPSGPFPTNDDDKGSEIHHHNDDAGGSYR